NKSSLLVVAKKKIIFIVGMILTFAGIAFLALGFIYYYQYTIESNPFKLQNYINLFTIFLSIGGLILPVGIFCTVISLMRKV
ncbi:MAG: hypothetical protein ACTSRA_22080, partial [Promethearchaeota archaeon]